MNELFDIQVNAQKQKTSGDYASSHKPTKVCGENERKKQTNKEEKQRARKNVIDGRKPFIRCIRRTGENDLNELRVNDSLHNEDTICLVNR